MIESGQLPELVGRPGFVMQVIKSFQNARVNYLFIQTDTATGKNFYYDAATRDAAKTQLGAWQQMYDQKLSIIKSDPRFKGRVQATLKRAIGRLQATRGRIDNAKFELEAIRLSQDIFDAIGIRFSPAYLHPPEKESLLPEDEFRYAAFSFRFGIRKTRPPLE